MEEIYYAANNPGSYGGIQRLARQAKKQDHPSNISNVELFLSKQDAYTLHKSKRYKFRRNKYILLDIDDLWQADLADMKSLAPYNNNNKYLLVVIDGLSKYLWVEPIVRKDSVSIVKAMQSILNRAKPRKPTNWLTDKGTEFRNRAIDELMKSAGINFYHTNNPDTKAAIAERVIRTIKARLYRYMTHKNTRKYVDALPEIVDSYNNSVHRTIGMAPASVKPEDVEGIKKRMYQRNRVNYKPVFKFVVGDTVRLAKEHQTFDKGYGLNWTTKIFNISKCIPRDPPVYKVQDAMGEEITGTFYAEELQKIIKTDNVYLVEKVLDERKRGSKTEYLIKWLGYPESMSSWEPKENLILK